MRGEKPAGRKEGNAMFFDESLFALVVFLYENNYNLNPEDIFEEDEEEA